MIVWIQLNLSKYNLYISIMLCYPCQLCLELKNENISRQNQANLDKCCAADGMMFYHIVVYQGFVFTIEGLCFYWNVTPLNQALLQARHSFV